MLCLKRKANEQIILTAPDGTEAVITVLGIEGCSVRLGIEAPKSVQVMRAEVAREKCRQHVDPWVQFWKAGFFVSSRHGK